MQNKFSIDEKVFVVHALKIRTGIIFDIGGFHGTYKYSMYILKTDTDEGEDIERLEQLVYGKEEEAKDWLKKFKQKRR